MSVVAAGVTLQPLTATVERSLLLGPDHLADFRAWCADHPAATPDDAAAWLIDQGWTTRWQAQQLLGGHHSFFLRHYKLVSRLGGGGMGTVFQAIDDRTGRLVAVKVIRKSAMQRPNAVERFKREIAALGKLRHPNIVAAYEAGQLGQYHYLVMEYIEGRDVGYWVSKLKKLPIDMACEIARQAALGLDHAHKHGFLHRDVKPSNLIAVRKSDGALDVRILDFGLARTYEGNPDEARVTRTGQIVGTVDYLAPEQAQGSNTVDGRADVYSLGVTLFEMIAGRTPFTGDSMMARLVARVMQPAPPLSDFAPDAPAALVEALAKALASQAEARFATAGEFAAALERINFGAPAETARASATTPALTAANPIDAEAAPVRTPESSPMNDEFQQALADKAKGSSDSQTMALPRWINERRGWLAAAAGAVLAVIVAAGIMSGSRKATAGQNEDPAPTTTDSRIERLAREATALRERPIPARIQRNWIELWALTGDDQPELVRRAARNLAATAPHPLEGTFEESQEQRTAYKPGWFEKLGAGDRAKKMAFASDGRTLASLGGRAIVLHDLIADSTQSLTAEGFAAPTCLAFSPSGETLAAGTQDGAIFIWDMSRRELLHTLPGNVPVGNVIFLGDGSQLAAGNSNNRLVLWTLSGGVPFAKSFDVPHAPVAFSLIPESLSVLIGGFDGRTTVLDLHTGKSKTNHLLRTRIVATACHPSDKQMLVVAAEGACWRIDGDQYTPAWSLPATPNSKWVGAWSSSWIERLVVLTEAGRLQWRSWTSGAVLWERESLADVRRASALAVSPDGRFAAVQIKDGTIEIVKLPPIVAQ